MPRGDLPSIFHRSTRTVDRWLAAGVLTPVKVGGSTYVVAAEIEALLAPTQRAPVATATAAQ